MTAEADVLARFDALFDALLVQRDSAAAGELLAADDDVVMWGSDEEERAFGPAEVADLHRLIANSRTRARFSWRDRHVHLEGDVAWVNAAGDVEVAPADGEPYRGPYRLTAIFVRRDGSWRLHTFSGCEPRTG